MKTFFDRLSSLITIDKAKGRALAGKAAWLIATGVEEYLPDGFEVPFVRTRKAEDLLAAARHRMRRADVCAGRHRGHVGGDREEEAGRRRTSAGRPDEDRDRCPGGSGTRQLRRDRPGWVARQALGLRQSGGAR